MNRLITMIFIALTSMLVASCGSIATFKDMPDIGTSIVLQATPYQVEQAAIAELDKLGMKLENVERDTKTIRIFASYVGAVALLMNSYGGYAKITIMDYEDGNIRVSAITRSTAVNEPVGASDALKGKNFNSIKIAQGILAGVESSYSDYPVAP